MNERCGGRLEMGMVPEQESCVEGEVSRRRSFFWLGGTDLH
jgi:hypothetical protein